MTEPTPKVPIPDAKPEPIGEGLRGHLSAVAAQVRDADPAPQLAHPTLVATLVWGPSSPTPDWAPSLRASDWALL